MYTSQSYSIPRAVAHTITACGLALAAANATAAEKPLKDEPDASWISLTGEVTETYDSGFRMDYGEGVVTVEMDDWDWVEEGQALLSGDDVTVYGRVDNNLYAKRTIEADSVYVEGLDTYFQANDLDEEEFTPLAVTAPIDLDDDFSYLTIDGTAKRVNGREVVVDTGATDLQVDTSTLNYNPMDDTGYQKVGKGDRIAVTGRLEDDFFDDLELEATALVTLAEDSGKSSS